MTVLDACRHSPPMLADSLSLGTLGWIAIPVGLLGIALICWAWPLFAFRFFLWVIVKLFYRVRVHGIENVPRQGGALLVCNHVSYLDWLYLLYAQPRPIRFVIFAAWTRTWGLRHLLRW